MKAGSVVENSNQTDLNSIGNRGFFDHWASVLGILVLVMAIGSGLGIWAAQRMEVPTEAEIAEPSEATLPPSLAPSEEHQDASIRSIFARVAGCISTARESIPVTFYIADTPELRQRGLQGVPGLPENHGMLFVYDSVQPSESQFWMYQTPMNLDISYLDSNGQIQSIQQMQSCSTDASSCPRYKAGIPFKAAAEFPQGFYRNNGITVGDRISLNAFGDCSNS
ncbi:DUF192 domain-containing protein [Marinobacter salsuginis]|jgi:uncharacterized membrane protein (UPF0127 family)|uniref:DUF192 domain-containing protein n=1 Tax=Marinobacter salsuginis TaxID=418719 RepID=UPI0010A9E6C1|nr:DUF192 domain-containing protein [Marinobacter salsuginis]